MKNPQAFPGEETATYDEKIIGRTYHPGMSLRDYFAGKALTGLSSYKTITSEEMAKLAYTIADAMLKAREPFEFEDLDSG